MVVPACACSANAVRVSVKLTLGARELCTLPAYAVPGFWSVAEIWEEVLSTAFPRPRYLTEFVAGLKSRGGRVLLDLGGGVLQDVHVTTRVGQLAVLGNDCVSLVLYAEQARLALRPWRKCTQKRCSIKRLETINECEMEGAEECDSEGIDSEGACNGASVKFSISDCISL